MKSLILSPEQKALRAWERRHSLQGQTFFATNAIERSLQGLADDLEHEGGQLQAPGIINALLNNLVHHVAQLPDGDREGFIRNVAHALPGRVQAAAIELAKREDE